MRFSLRSAPGAADQAVRHDQNQTPTSFDPEKVVESGPDQSTRRISRQESDTISPHRTDLAHERHAIHANEKADGQHAHGLHGEDLVDFPLLNYSIYRKRRRLKIFLYFLLLFVESCLLPEALFYGLTFGAHLDLQVTFGIVTGLCGAFSPIKFFLGAFKLCRRKTTDRCRPLGQSNRWAFDFTHITVTVGYTIFIVILIIGTAPHTQITPLIAMAVPAFVFWTGCVLLFLQLLHHLDFPAPFRISSAARGSMVPPGVYPYIEDICAVEGHGNREFRERLKARYEASPIFRSMLTQVSWLWISGCFATSIACAAIIGSTEWYIGYAFGWGLPFLWAGLWAGITALWVIRSLRKEKATWSVLRKP